MSLFRNSVFGVLALAAMAVAVAPNAVFADRDHAVRITGTFTLATVVPSAVDHCASAGGGTPVVLRGLGKISKLGPLFLTAKKCRTVVGGVPTFVGTFTMTAANGDTLNGDYLGKRIGSLDENGYGEFQGTWTVTGGTGRFSHASGVLSWTALTGPSSLGATPPTVTAPSLGVAFYLVQGTMSSPEKD